MILDAMFNPKPVGQISKEMQPIKDNYSETLVNKEDFAAISNFASTLSDLDKYLKDPSSNKGTDGLREVAKHFAGKPEEFDSFIKSVDKLDNENFKDVFSTISDMKDNGISTDKFISTFSSLSDAKSVQGFLDSAKQIINDSGLNAKEQEKALNQLSSAVKSVTDSDLTQKEKTEQLDNLFGSVSKTKNLTELETALDKFMKA